MPFVSLGIVLVKYMIKQSELIFFRSDKKFEVAELWENKRIISSIWMKEECGKRIYYQTTQFIHWNLVRITTAKIVMWCDIFHLFVGRNKKRKPAMEGNCWLNINIEDHMADLHGLFQYFKKCGFSYLLLFHYIIIFFFLLVVGQKKANHFAEIFWFR